VWRTHIPAVDPFVVWVNKSAGAFLRSEPVDTVRDVLSATGLDPGSLGVEITESVFMSNTAPMGSAVRDLKSLGVAIAIDDFGTGFSSLGYLKRFPVDALKVDSSFVGGIGREPETSLVTACLALADSLGINTIAEGVETLEQARWLSENGCTSAQGHYFTRPVEAGDAMKFLAATAGRGAA
jgi:EAL domain-containing protein (putative c-di-GMP-specific phosphodiesterase class I)